MDEEHASPFGAVYLRDPCACAAYVSAASAPQAFARDRRDLYEEVIYWPSLKPGFVEGGLVAQASLCIDVLAPFVRANPKAPTEALFRHAAARGVHMADPNGWAALPVGQRAAYEVFALALLCLDGLADGEERRERSQNPQIPRADFVPVEDTILRGSGGAAELHPMYAEERRVVITEGSGLAPGHAPGRPKPPPPIGPDNTERPAEFFTQRRTPPPSAPLLSSTPGTSPELGHGFDASQPFNETGAPPPGQAPASAAEAIGGTTAVAAPPAAPAPAPDAPANPPEQEESDDAHETGQGRELEAAPARAADAPADRGGARGAAEPAPAADTGVSGGGAEADPTPAVHESVGGKGGAPAVLSAAPGDGTTPSPRRRRRNSTT